MNQSDTASPSQTGKDPSEAGSLRVALFSDSFPERNGAGAYYFDLAGQLEPALEAFKMFQPVVKKRFLKFALPLPGDSTQKLITPNIFRIRREFAELQPHLVIGVTPGPFGLLGLYLARRNKIPFITAFHTHFEGLIRLYGNNILYRTAHWYLKRINMILCRRSVTVLVNNTALISTVNELGAPRVDVMGTPLSSEFLATAIKPPRGRLEQVLFAGRLAPEKNLPVILEAIKALPDIRFVIAGDGPLRSRMEKARKACPNLRLTGWLDRPRLRGEMDNADLLILPSHMETFGTVALEAMARGRPAMVAASAGIHQWPVLEDALFKLEEGTSVKQGLREIADLSPEVWQEKALAARKAAQTLNQETITDWIRLVVEHAR